MAKTKETNVYRPDQPRPKIAFTKPSRTKQEFKDECDANAIIKRFNRTGQFPVPTAQPRYLDTADIPDLQTALHILADADAAFMKLPSHIRKEFDNSPINFVEFATNPENLDKLREWKLAPEAPKPAEPTRVHVVNAPENKLDQ